MQLQLPLQWPLPLPLLLTLGPVCVPPCRRCPEREKVRRLSERRAAERV